MCTEKKEIIKRHVIHMKYDFVMCLLFIGFFYERNIKRGNLWEGRFTMWSIPWIKHEVGHHRDKLLFGISFNMCFAMTIDKGRPPAEGIRDGRAWQVETPWPQRSPLPSLTPSPLVHFQIACLFRCLSSCIIMYAAYIASIVPRSPVPGIESS